MFDIYPYLTHDGIQVDLMKVKPQRIPIPVVRPRHHIIFAACLGLICLGIFGLAAPQLRADAQDTTVMSIRVENTINPVKARFISRAIKRSTEADARLLVIELNTPGGLYDSTRRIVESMLESGVPVAVFVSPRGAHAGSAGTFITAAGHVAAMAPGSNIGAATPISGSGEDLEETLADKATNDAAALIRAIADERGRNADVLEETVRTAASFTAQEALDANIIDLIAGDVSDLLDQIDGRVVTTATGERTLEVAGADVQPLKMQWRERFVDLLANPNVAFLLLTLGGLGLVFELMTPGTIGPGVAGAILLLLAFLALGNLPFNWAGVVFIGLSGVLAALEIFVSGFGALGIGAVVSLIVGGLLLFGGFGSGGGIPANFPDVSISLWVLAGVGGVLALGAGYFAFEAVLSRRRNNAVRESSGLFDSDGRSSAAHLVGQVGVVTSPLQPRGIVALREETWSAISNDGIHVPAGRHVRVVRSEGLMVLVEEMAAGAPAPEGQE